MANSASAAWRHTTSTGDRPLAAAKPTWEVWDFSHPLTIGDLALAHTRCTDWNQPIGRFPPAGFGKSATNTSCSCGGIPPNSSAACKMLARDDTASSGKIPTWRGCTPLRAQVARLNDKEDVLSVSTLSGGSLLTLPKLYKRGLSSFSFHRVDHFVTSPSRISDLLCLQPARSDLVSDSDLLTYLCAMDAEASFASANHCFQEASASILSAFSACSASKAASLANIWHRATITCMIRLSGRRCPVIFMKVTMLLQMALNLGVYFFLASS